MRIDKLRLTHFRCFDEAEYEFDKRMTLIVGDNAKGKTTLLEALSVAMGGFLLGVPNSYLGSTKQAFIRNLQVRDIQRKVLTDRDTPMFEYQENCQVQADGSVGKLTSISWSRLLPKAGGRPKNDGCGEIKFEAGRIYKTQISDNENQSPEDLPVLIYYGTGRLWAGQKTKGDNQLKETNIAFGYYYSLKPDAQNKTLMPWLEQADRIAYRQRAESPRLNAVLDTITAMLPDATDCFYAPEFGELVVEFGSKTYSFSDLSDGQRNIVMLAGDLAMRCAHLNQHLGKDAARKTPGIVLVDEIDANIHPSWQKNLLPSLMDCFENIQFVVTSHSPFILQSLDQGKIINLDRAQNPEQNADQWNRGVEDIVTEVMGVDTPRSALYERMMATAGEYYDLLDAGRPLDDAKVKVLSDQLDQYELEFSEHPAYVALLKAQRKKQGLDG
ncbi:putative ATP-binding protein involved in virulence [Aeromonas caviae]|uniref:AAA family ATPase n=1 Tax=Aeromonas caviae TaxID=648 RepID=UPI00209F8957|nr:AAA family ATPase [Aeromonas caviae]MCP1601732.1 putative ATP-binding protein involved in virulence [Aeromonas caviae]